MGLPKFYQSGISRLEKEQRVARNKEINVVKESEVVDDAAVAANTTAIALNTAKTGITSAQADQITSNRSTNSQSAGLCAALSAFMTAGAEGTLADAITAYNDTIESVCE